MTNQQYIYKPREIILDKRLTAREGDYLCLINQLEKAGNCTASNNYFARYFGVSRPRAVGVIAALKNKNYIASSERKKGLKTIERTIWIIDVNSKETLLMVSKKSLPMVSKENVSRVSKESSNHTIEEETVEETTDEESISFVKLWNSKKNLPEIKLFTPQRKIHFQARMREPLFAENWREVICKLSSSSFCTGKNNRGWLADVDWVLNNATNYAKVLEGKYDDKEGDAGKITEQDGYEGYQGDVIGNDGNVITHAFSDEEIENLRVQGVHI